MTGAPPDAFAVVERVVHLLEQGAQTATYKHAVLLGLIEVCQQSTGKGGVPPDVITTRQLAEAVVALYWSHTRPWPSAPSLVLRQNASARAEVGSSTIVGRVHAFRQRIDGETTVATPLVRAKVLAPERWEQLLDEVEWILVEMPLPKLQRVGGRDETWLYVLGFDDGAHRPSRAAVRRSRLGARGDFDNRIQLLPGVGEALVRLAVLLRAFIQQQWAQKVAHLNQLEEARLELFLFGQDRENLAPVRAPLSDLQRGRCFYCDGRLRADHTQVDHFLPWVRLPENGLANLVVADRTCNGQKRDFLADHLLLRRWRERLELQGTALAALSAANDWELAEERTLKGARALYGALPAQSRLWGGRDRWTQSGAEDLLGVLG